MKFFYWLLALALVAITGLFTYTDTSSNKDQDWLTTTVSIDDIELSVLANGRLNPRQLINVGAEVSGQLKTLHVRLGEPVNSGQLIAEIDARQQQSDALNGKLAIAHLKAQRNAATAEHLEARLRFDRLSALSDSQVIAQTELDIARASLDVAQSQIDALDITIQQRTTQLEIANVKLALTQIIAPMDGVVVGVATKQGQTVNAAQTAPTIVTLAQLDIMTVQAKISEVDILKVHSGQDVYFTTLASPDRRYYGKINQIEPAPESIGSNRASSNAIYYNALFDIENTDGSLYPSMTAKVHIIVESAQQVTTVAVSALGKKQLDGSYAITVIDDNNQKVESSVTIGINNNVRAQVLSGLGEGDRVIIASDSGSSSSSVVE